MIYGPAVMNAEVISYKDSWEDVEIIGISQGREHEKTIVKESYPQIRELKEVSSKGILYALEDGQVDGVVQDLTKAAKVSDYPYQPLSETDYISYALVVDKEFAKTQAFSDFIRSYNKAVSKLNIPEYLAQKMDVDKEWIEHTSVEFLPMEESEE